MTIEQDAAQAAKHSDEWCIRALSLRQQEGLQPLFTRYAPLVFHIASESLGHESAEDIVQDVFLTVWRRADTFDPHRRAFRPWLMQIAHNRILNESRARSRRPVLDAEGEVDGFESLPDSRSEPVEAAGSPPWQWPCWSVSGYIRREAA